MYHLLNLGDCVKQTSKTFGITFDSILKHMALSIVPKQPR